MNAAMYRARPEPPMTAARTAPFARSGPGSRASRPIAADGVVPCPD